MGSPNRKSMSIATMASNPMLIVLIQTSPGFAASREFGQRRDDPYQKFEAEKQGT